MPKRIVSWGVLLFSFAVVSLGYKPERDQWGFGYDSHYHVPFLSSPYTFYEVLGTIAIVLSLFFIIASFRSKWRDGVEEFVTTKASYPSFVVFSFVYVIGFLRGLGALISISPPIWIAYLVFYYGIIMFVLLVVMYVRGLAEQKVSPQQVKSKPTM